MRSAAAQTAETAAAVLLLSMARKKKASAPPPPPPPPPAASNPEPSSSSSSDEDQQQFIAKPAAPLAQTLKRKAPSDSESDSDSDSDPPAKNSPAAPDKPTVKSLEPSWSEEEDTEEEGDEAEQKNEVEEALEPKSPTKVQESGNKKPKLSAIHRIWTDEDELVLLRALSEYRAKHGKLPFSKDYGIILSLIIDKISFPVTEKQIWNKIRTLRYNYSQRMQKKSDVVISNPHERSVFQMSAELFEESRNKNVSSNTKTKTSARIKTEKTTSDGVVGMGETHGARANNGTGKRSYFYLGELVKTEAEQLPKWISVVDHLVENIGHSKAQKLEKKTKELWMDTMKLHARKKKLIAEVFDALTNDMTGGGVGGPVQEASSSEI